MGLCPRLPELQTARPRASLLHASLQLASPSCQYRRQATHHQTWPDQGQPVEAPQLVRSDHRFSSSLSWRSTAKVRRRPFLLSTLHSTFPMYTLWTEVCSSRQRAVTGMALVTSHFGLASS